MKHTKTKSKNERNTLRHRKRRILVKRTHIERVKKHTQTQKDKKVN
jgi:hypothetical protein